MIRVNLVRDRVRRPATLAERLAPVAVVMLVVVYGATVLLILALSAKVFDQNKALRLSIEQRKRLYTDVGEFPTKYSDEELRLIQHVQDMVLIAARKWHCGTKLSAMEAAMPTGIVLGSFYGRAKSAIVLQGNAFGTPEDALKTIVAFIRKLQGNEGFTDDVEAIFFRSASAPVRSQRTSTYLFTIECTFGPEEQPLLPEIVLEGEGT